MKPKAVAMHVFGAGFLVGAEDHVEVVADLETFDAFEGTLRRNRPNLDYRMDPDAGWDWSEWKGMDILFGNPRCSAFSPINIGYEKKGSHGCNGKQTIDVRQFWAAIRGIRPQYAVFESVQQIGSKGRPILDSMYADLSRIGYRFAEVYFDNKDLGVPQRRKRFFGIAYREEKKFNILEMPSKYTTVIERIGDLENVPAISTRRDITFDDEVQGHLADGTPVMNHAYLELDHKHPIEIIHEIEQGKSTHHLEDEQLISSDYLYSRRQAGKTFGWAPVLRLRANGLSNVIYSRSFGYIHPHLHRPITFREGARLMGFPDDWALMGGKGFVQVGNGVAVEVGSWIIGEIVRNMGSDSQDDFDLRWDPKKRITVPHEASGALVKRFELNTWTVIQN